MEILALVLAAWNFNFPGAPTVTELSYQQYLNRVPAYLQQLATEGNGKQVTPEGACIDYQSGPIYRGEPGTNGQLFIYPFIRQETLLIPCGFIGVFQALNPIADHHDSMMSSLSAQTEALAFGKTDYEVMADGMPPWVVPDPEFEGNHPGHNRQLTLDSSSDRPIGRYCRLPTVGT